MPADDRLVFQGIAEREDNVLAVEAQTTPAMPRLERWTNSGVESSPAADLAALRARECQRRLLIRRAALGLGLSAVMGFAGWYVVDIVTHASAKGTVTSTWRTDMLNEALSDPNGAALRGTDTCAPELTVMADRVQRDNLAHNSTPLNLSYDALVQAAKVATAQRVLCTPAVAGGDAYTLPNPGHDGTTVTLSGASFVLPEYDVTNLCGADGRADLKRQIDGLPAEVAAANNRSIRTTVDYQSQLDHLNQLLATATIECGP